MKKITTIRLAELTEIQLAELQIMTGLNQTQVIQTAIDRMYREENKMINKTEYTAWVINSQGASESISYKDNTNAQEIYAFARRKYGAGWILHVREIGAQDDMICVTLK